MGFRIIVGFAFAALLLGAPAARAGIAVSCNGPHNGILDGSEECETGACCTPSCGLAHASLICRAGDHPICDPDEVCDGVKPAVDAACPQDYLAPHETPCDDGSACTDDDECDDGSCDGGVLAVKCDDKNPCTLDFCDPQSAECVFAPRESPCSDGFFCTDADACVAGTCSGVPRSCDDANACTDDSCSEATDACVYAPNISPCDDEDPCTTGDACSEGSCGGEPDPGCGPTTTTTMPQCPVCGDVNDDCHITASDALAVLKGAVDLGDCPLFRCDANGDLKLSANDALRVLRAAVGQAFDPKCPPEPCSASSVSGTR